jgi:hypothetical protein
MDTLTEKELANAITFNAPDGSLFSQANFKQLQIVGVGDPGAGNGGTKLRFGDSQTISRTSSSSARAAMRCSTATPRICR